MSVEPPDISTPALYQLMQIIHNMLVHINQTRQTYTSSGSEYSSFSVSLKEGLHTPDGKGEIPLPLMLP